MFRQVRMLAALGGGLSLLAACASGQPFNQTGSGVVPSSQRANSPSIAPDKGCGGVNGVKVTPCPITLNRRTKSGVVVTVTGPKVVDSALGTIRSCYSGHDCYNVERNGSSQTQWLISSGALCGGAILEFRGKNANGRRVGYAFLEISNKYCP